MNNIRIVQSSPPHTGSTLLMNLIHGLLCPDESALAVEDVTQSLITKTHNINIENIERKFPNYKLYFIMSERNDNKIHSLINNKYRNKNNVLIINYNEILETQSNDLDKVINHIFDKFINFLPKELLPTKSNESLKEAMKDRINKMNEICLIMKDKPFAEWDRFTGIHGGHRNRKK